MGVLAVKPGPKHFQPLTDLVVAGEIAVHVDRTFDVVPAALGYVGNGHALGKVVVTVNGATI